MLKFNHYKILLMLKKDLFNKLILIAKIIQEIVRVN